MDPLCYILGTKSLEIDAREDGVAVREGDYEKINPESEEMNFSYNNDTLRV